MPIRVESPEIDTIRGGRLTMGVTAVVGCVLGLSAFLVSGNPAQGRGTKPPSAPARGPKAGEETPAQAASRLADQLKRHPAPVSAGFAWRVYLMDLVQGDVTLIADTPDRG